MPLKTIKDFGWDEDNFLRAAERVQNAHASTDDVARALNKLGKAMAAVDLLPLPEIALARMAQLKDQFGCGRFLVSDYWRWRKFANKS